MILSSQPLPSSAASQCLHSGPTACVHWFFLRTQEWSLTQAPTRGGRISLQVYQVCSTLRYLCFHCGKRMRDFALRCRLCRDNFVFSSHLLRSLNNAPVTFWSRQMPSQLSHGLHSCFHPLAHVEMRRNIARVGGGCLFNFLFLKLFFKKISWDIGGGWIHQILKCQSWKAA